MRARFGVGAGLAEQAVADFAEHVVEVAVFGLRDEAAGDVLAVLLQSHAGVASVHRGCQVAARGGDADFHALHHRGRLGGRRLRASPFGGFESGKPVNGNRGPRYARKVTEISGLDQSETLTQLVT